MDETEKRVRNKCMYYKRMETDTRISIKGDQIKGAEKMEQIE